MVERDAAVAVLGLGPVGRAFARGLARAGLELVLWSRDPRRAEAVRGATARVERDLGAAAAGAGTVLFCVSEDALAEVVRAVAASAPATADPPPVALHPNGYLGLEVLAPLARAGWSTGKLHPLAPFPPEEARPGRLRGAWCVLDGDRRARARAVELVARVGGRPLSLAAGAPAGRYHAAASLLVGGLAVLFDQAEAVAAGSFEEADAFRSALAHLARITLGNVERDGPRDALTGPVSRGNLALVEGHLRALADAPEAAALYRAIGARMAELALARGSIDAARRDALATLFRT